MRRVPLLEIKKRLANATPGPWKVEYGPRGKIQNTRIISEDGHELTLSNSEVHSMASHIATIWNVTCTCVQGHQYDNQSFIANARTDVEILVKEVERLYRELRKYEVSHPTNIEGR